jgi:transcriptional regulator with XRE-family HTH domain
MTGSQVEAFRKRYGISRKYLGEILGVCEKTIQNWEKDRRRKPIHKGFVEGIKELRKLYKWMGIQPSV